MGKGYIIAHKGDGLYDVRLTYAYRSRITAKLATYTGQIAELDIKITAETDVNKKAILKLQRASAQKLYDYYSTKMPADPAVEAWCADLTENLAYGTVVGTMEIPGEKVTVLVRPSYNGRSVYSASRDGALMPAIAGSAHQVLFNWMLLPGWQRHKPIYRIGTIIADSIDRDAHTCSICLEPAYSSQQNLPAIDSTGVSACGSTTPLGLSASTAMADYCSRYPAAGLCTNTEDGTPIELSDAQLADLQAVNDYVNNNYGRKTDASGFRTGESWDEMAPGGSGDCEDFCLTKAKRLIDNYGWNPRDLKIAVGFTENGEGHATLAVRTTNRGILILDNRNSAVVQHTRLSYKFDSIALQKDNWKTFTRQLDLVPIEYMQCNSHAFSDGDRVVVEFLDQKWETPKVIGFHSSPESCTFNVYALCNWYYGGGVWFSTDTYTFHALGVMPLPYAWRYRCAGAAIGKSILCVSGLGFIYGAVGFPYLALIDKNTQFDSLTYSYIDKQAIPTPRECLTGYGYGGKAWFAGGLDIFDQGWYGPDTTSSTNVYWCGPQYTSPFSFECPEWMNSVYSTEPTPYSNNEEFTFLSNSWAFRQGVSNPSGFARGFGVSGLLYIFGGVDGKIDKTVVCTCCLERYGDGSYGRHYTTYNNEYVDLVRDGKVYNPSSDAWLSLQDMPEERAGYASAVVSGIGYVFHGSTSVKLSSGDMRQSAELRLEDQDLPIPEPYEYYSWGHGSCSYPGGAFELWKTMTARKYNPATNSWSSIATSPNNGNLYPTDRDYFGTGINGNEGYPAAAVGTRIALCQSTSMTSMYGDNTVMEYDPVADTYSGKGSKSQMADVMGDSLTHFGEIGFSL